MIIIDYQSRKPIYEQIVERFELLIASGALDPDSQLPSVRALAMNLSINPNTIQKAYAMLEEEGYIYSVKGKGNYVSRDARLLQRQQQSFYRSMGDLVEKGKLLGVTKEEFVGEAEKFYEGEEEPDD